MSSIAAEVTMAAKKNKTKHGHYTKTQRDKVLADVRLIGVNAAAEKHGVPQSSVSRWSTAAGVKRSKRKGGAVTSSAHDASGSQTTCLHHTKPAKIYWVQICGWRQKNGAQRSTQGHRR